MELVTIRNLSFRYPRQARNALTDVSLTLSAGDFVVLAGPSGCGKSTLLRQIKTVLAPHGTRTGEVLYGNRPLDELSAAEQAAKIGFVLQSPDSQIVTDKVWHELAFGLESQGFDQTTIRGRVAEMASFFGIQTWFHMDTNQLSGGQKQLLNLASIMVLQPDLLILDEPTSQLDPIAATDFLQTLGRINRELGTTILICEHRLEDVIPMANRLVILDGGKVLCDDTPRGSFARLREMDHPMLLSMPTPMRVWSGAGLDGDCPLTVSDGRIALTSFADGHELKPVPRRPAKVPAAEPCAALEEIWFRYDRESPDVLKGVSVKAYPGVLLCILGGNGTGKSTMLRVLSGVRKPYRGKRMLQSESVAALPQNPQMLLVHKTLREELLSAAPAADAAQMAALCHLEGLMDRHPYDLSGGEQQRAALAKVLLQKPQILLLDEPTKGVDNAFKEDFARILKDLTARGICIIMVSHDVEFCAQYADRCGLFFDGSIVTLDAPQPFFSGKSFYTTAANRMARHLLPEAVTAEDVIESCGGTVPENQPKTQPPQIDMTPPKEGKPPKRPRWRSLLSLFSGASALALLWYVLTQTNQALLYSGWDYFAQYGWMYLAMFALFALCLVSISQRPSVKEQRLLSGTLDRRTKLMLAICLLAIPLTLWLGMHFGGGRKYLITSMLIVVETMLPFFLVFEGRKPRARELVILSVLSALAIGGRAVFMALPAFKPVAAMVILTGVAFGAESGFLVGAVTMLVSNMLFGQGPWTPWQMFAMGVMGLIPGILFHRGLLHRSRLGLSIFGGVTTLLVYGGIMNPASVLMYQSEPTWKMILTACVTGVPVDAVHAGSTALFLWLLAEPMLEKLDRVKVKYGLMEEMGEKA